MPLLAADPVTVLPEQRDALEHLVRIHSTPQQLALRARIVVQAADGVGVRASARELGVWREHPARATEEAVRQTPAPRGYAVRRATICRGLRSGCRDLPGRA